MRHNIPELKEVPESYLEAEFMLTKIINKVERSGIEFPSIKSTNFDLEKYSPTSLSEDISNNVRLMGVHIDNDYRSMMAYFEPGSYIKPCLHPDEVIVFQVLKGEIIENVSCEIYEEGDTFVVKKNQLHEIIAETKATVFMTFSDSWEVLENLFKSD
jgi:quercetin dioxygenase-like cupin family protein